MSIANTSTVCSGIEWNSLLGLLVRLIKTKRNREYLLRGTGTYLGLRASDLLNLRWSDFIDKDEVVITEKKTGKIQ
jgi:integrase